MTEKLEVGKDIMALAVDLLSACRQRGELIVTAESCTGGLLAATLTAIPGCSDCFERGFVTYSNASKSEMLGVPFWLIERHGAVSEDVARAMAGGALTHSRADLAVAVTGIAGPDGGTEEKPVGLVYVHAEGPSGGLGREFNFPGDRVGIRARSVVIALHLVRTLLARSSDEVV
jgi:nicotinamide-nucleotide amidase